MCGAIFGPHHLNEYFYRFQNSNLLKDIIHPPRDHTLTPRPRGDEDTHPPKLSRRRNQRDRCSSNFFAPRDMAPRGPPAVAARQTMMSTGGSGTETKDTSEAFQIPYLPTDSPSFPAPGPPGLKLPLLPHQLRALYRMQLLERDGSLTGESGEGFNTFLEYKSRGGVLSDAVGLGKTCTSLALILSDDPENDPAPTLVVAPSHLLPQWRDEVRKFVGEDGPTVVVLRPRRSLSFVFNRRCSQKFLTNLTTNQSCFVFKKKTMVCGWPYASATWTAPTPCFLSSKARPRLKSGSPMAAPTVVPSSSSTSRKFSRRKTTGTTFDSCTIRCRPCPWIVPRADTFSDTPKVRDSRRRRSSSNSVERVRAS